jgi:hypothetical protein
VGEFCRSKSYPEIVDFTTATCTNDSSYALYLSGAWMTMMSCSNYVTSVQCARPDQ